MGCGSSIDYVKPFNIRCTSETIESRRNSGLDRQILTQHQMKLVKKTWRYLADDMTGRGIKVFKHIFAGHEDLIALFPFRESSLDSLDKDPRFRGHASRFMQAVGAVMDNLEDPTAQLSPLLIDLGRRHSQTSGFDINLFDHFIGAMIEVWREELGPKFTPEVQAAWGIVFQFLTHQLKDGYSMHSDSANKLEKESLQG